MKRKSLTPNQEEAAKVETEKLVELAKAVPSKIPSREPSAMLPVIDILLNEKGMFWTEIARWLYENTEFYRSAPFWKKLYTERRDG